MGRRYHVSFICSGNICRSPIAEKVFAREVEQAGLADRVRVTSAGTGSWHVGDPADSRAAALLAEHGYDDTHVARQIDDELLDADLLVALDAGHLRALRRIAPDPERMRLLREFDPDAPAGAGVPDPYYGGPEGFTEVLDDDPRGDAGAAGVRQGPAVIPPTAILARRCAGPCRWAGVPRGWSWPTAGRSWSRRARGSPRRRPGSAGSPFRAGRRCRRCSRSTARGSSPSTCRRDGRRQPRPPSSAGGSRRCTPAGAPAPSVPGRREPRRTPGSVGRRCATSRPRSGHRGTPTHRVAPYLATARDAGDLTADEAAVIERVCDRLPELAGPPEPPARLHGDLWSGNVLWSTDGAWLIDPAAHGGHRETDLAMLALFGCPHLDTVLAAYDEAAPLAPGWRDRVPLHQLFPLLVHVVLFGRGYAGQCVAAARAALGSR